MQMMEEKYDVTIIIPVYNVEKYIQRCLESVIEQETDELSIECLLIDDCTPDDSISIAQRIVEGYCGSICFRFLRHEQNRGLSAARNTGIDAAQGDFLLFLDSDDYLASGVIGKMFQAKAKYPETMLVMGKYVVGRDVLPDYGSVGYLNEAKQIKRMYLEEKLPLMAWNKLLNRNFLIDNSLYFEEGLLFEDILWSYRLFSNLDSLVVIPDIIYYYEDIPTSIMRTISKRADHAMCSFVETGNKLYESPFCDLYALHKLFIFRLVAIKATDLYIHSNLPTKTKKMFQVFRHRLMADVIHHRQFLLSAFFLLMYSPFCHFLKFAFFRHHFDQIYRLVMRLSH